MKKAAAPTTMEVAAGRMKEVVAQWRTEAVARMAKDPPTRVLPEMLAARCLVVVVVVEEQAGSLALTGVKPAAVLQP